MTVSSRCSTCVGHVEGALGVVGGAVVQGAVEGALVENGRHVAVWRQRRPQLRVDLPRVTGVWAVEPCRYTSEETRVIYTNKIIILETIYDFKNI